MKIITILLFLFLYGTSAAAQNSYIVNTSMPKTSVIGEEDSFIEQNFPLQILCDWTPGMKFMFIPSGKELFMPIFFNYDDERSTDNVSLKFKILDFIGIEEKKKEIYSGTNYSTRFVFECEGKKYYSEFKNTSQSDLCKRNPRASIAGLVYLKDVDIARETLVGKVVYFQARIARVDDPNSYSGYKDVTVPKDERVTITEVGVGSKSYPVKIIFEDSKGNSLYAEVALSRTNSGMDVADFQAEKKMRYFSNAFSFTNKSLNSLDAIKNKYIGLTVYPKKTIEAVHKMNIEDSSTEHRVILLRYTSLIIKNIDVKAPSTLANLILQDKQGNLLSIETDLKYDFIIKNTNFIEDILGMGDLHKKYPYITEEHWKLIAQGEIEPGMTADECKLALGRPIEVQIQKDTRFETWLYNGKILEFESGRLLRFK